MEDNKKDFNPITNRRVWDLLENYRDSNDQRARSELLERGLPFVRGVAHRYSSGGFLLGDSQDIVGMGVIGLAKALDKWDPKRSWSWLRYVQMKIRNEVMWELARQKRATCQFKGWDLPYICGEGRISVQPPSTEIRPGRPSGGWSREHYPSAPEHASNIRSRGPAPDARLAESDAFDHLIKPLAGLERQAILSIYWAGKTLSEVASDLSLPRSDVQIAARKGVLLLRKRIRHGPQETNSWYLSHDPAE